MNVMSVRWPTLEREEGRGGGGGGGEEERLEYEAMYSTL